MVVASLLYAVSLYRAYGALDTLSPYIYIINSWYYCLTVSSYARELLMPFGEMPEGTWHYWKQCKFMKLSHLKNV